jgi:hypothetical protein
MRFFRGQGVELGFLNVQDCGPCATGRVKKAKEFFGEVSQGQIRNPKSETRKKPEARNSNPVGASFSTNRPALDFFEFQASDLLSDPVSPGTETLRPAEFEFMEKGRHELIAAPSISAPYL